MLPPVLEVFIVFHPEDYNGEWLANEIANHFMENSTFSGIIGGGIQVSIRAQGWSESKDAPRPIYSQGNHPPSHMKSSDFTIIVPLIGNEMAGAVENTDSCWHAYISEVDRMHSCAPDSVGVFPYLMDSGAINETELAHILGKYQMLAAGSALSKDMIDTICRDLTQGIAQLLSPSKSRLTVFISHTKRSSFSEGKNVDALIALVRNIISKTRLNDFFDANDLQPGTDWDSELRSKSASSAMLSIRTDLYASREWCQREVSIAKTNGMPVIMMDAIGHAEERGSFIMDHTTRIAVRKSDNGDWRETDVFRAMNHLVDECLKRAIWMHQKKLTSSRPELDISWWAPHAPEPLTLSHWIKNYLDSGSTSKSDIRVLHPDPPLGPEELEILKVFVENTKVEHGIDIMTPRQLATRGG